MERSNSVRGPNANKTSFPRSLWFLTQSDLTEFSPTKVFQVVLFNPVHEDKNTEGRHWRTQEDWDRMDGEEQRLTLTWLWCVVVTITRSFLKSSLFCNLQTLQLASYLSYRIAFALNDWVSDDGMGWDCTLFVPVKSSHSFTLSSLQPLCVCIQFIRLAQNEGVANVITSYFKKPDFLLSVLECSPVVLCPDAALNSMSHPVKRERGRPEPQWPPPACGPDAGDLFSSQPHRLRFIRNSFTHWMLIGGNGNMKRL